MDERNSDADARILETELEYSFDRKLADPDEEADKVYRSVVEGEIEGRAFSELKIEAYEESYDELMPSELTSEEYEDSIGDELSTDDVERGSARG